MKPFAIVQWVATFAVGSALVFIEALRSGGPNWLILSIAGGLFASPALMAVRRQAWRIEITPIGGRDEPHPPA